MLAPEVKEHFVSYPLATRGWCSANFFISITSLEMAPEGDSCEISFPGCNPRKECVSTSYPLSRYNRKGARYLLETGTMGQPLLEPIGQVDQDRSEGGSPQLDSDVSGGGSRGQQEGVGRDVVSD